MKIVARLVLLLLVLAGGGIGWMSFRSPDQRLPVDVTIERTPERVARGRYLVNHVMDCVGCHSDHYWDRFGSPAKPDALLQGGFVFDEKFAVPGEVAAQNLTPDPQTGKANWTDGEILRAMREGVSRDGHALFPMMPYQDYARMSDEDAFAVVAYLRTVPAINKVIPPSKIAFPVNMFIKFAPQPLGGPVPAIDPKNHIVYGEYLATMAGCHECHTPHDDKGQKLIGKDFSGGWTMAGPWGRNVTPNLTPHPSTFIGQSDKAAFIARFKSYETMTATTSPIMDKGDNTIMPWLGFSHMAEDDLGAIYDYLKTVPPIENRVDPFPDAKKT